MTFNGSEVVTTGRLVFFWKPPAPYSQWTSSPFSVDGVRYTHAEQFMMAEKARLFGDSEVLARVMQAGDPRLQKALGQQVRNFDEALWVAKRFDIVVRGNIAKFGQSEELRRALANTGDRQLVEASPRDRIWGIGLRADDPRALDPAQWRGANLLGQALVEVRRQLCRA